MGQKEKLIKKLMSKPKDFTFAEAETLLNYFDYVRSNKICMKYIYYSCILTSDKRNKDSLVR